MKLNVHINCYIICALASLAFASSPARAQSFATYHDLRNFGVLGTRSGVNIYPDGINPNSVMFDSHGNLFGTTSSGGANGDGTLWEMTKAGLYLDLHDFGGTIKNANGASGPDGLYPNGIAVDAAGDVYGTTNQGGPLNALGGGDGMLWELTLGGTYKDLHDFGGMVINSGGVTVPDGANPNASPTLSRGGNLVGTASEGGKYGQPNGSFGGIVWEITPLGTYKDLHDFGGIVMNASGTNGPDGWGTASGVKIDNMGNIVGTAQHGGPNGSANSPHDGVLWEITSTETYKDLHDFGGTVSYADGSTGLDGIFPGEIAFNTAGVLYGTTEQGGSVPAGHISSLSVAGIIWNLTLSGIYTDLHNFGGTVVNANGLLGIDGFRPAGIIAIDNSGNLYGTTAEGGANDGSNFGFDGIAWELSASGAYNDLHDFGGSATDSTGASEPDGQIPGGVMFDSRGNIYGTANEGGSIADGTLWELPNASAVSAVSVTVAADGDTRLLWNLHGAADIWRVKPSGTLAKAVHIGPFPGWTPRLLSANKTNGSSLLWTNASGAQDIWQLDENGNYLSDDVFGPFPGWGIAGIGAGGSDGNSRLLWVDNDTADVWVTNSGGYISDQVYGPNPGWLPIGIGTASDNTSRLLWTNVNGTADLWTLSPTATYVHDILFGPFDGWSATGLAVAPDGTTRLTWTNATGAIDVWNLNSSSKFLYNAKFGPFPSFSSPLSALAPDDTGRLLWVRNDGLANLWATDSINGQGVLSSVDFGPF